MLALAVYSTGRQNVVHAQTAPAGTVDSPLDSLKKVRTPEPTNLNQFLNTDASGRVSSDARAAAIALGKALFWDQAVGSDGQACGSCHFAAGADSRTFNQMNPGLRAVPPITQFQAPFTANFQLHAADFPLFQQHPGNHAIVSSQGVTRAPFVDIVPGNPNDIGGPFADPIFNAGGHNVRAVEPRNTPTMINAVFNFRNFWDGRARNEFNGVDPFGDLNPLARVLIANGQTLQKVRLTGNLRLENASLASQAAGPPLSDLEMSFANRTFAKVGKKMLAFEYALPLQMVAPDDSVFSATGAFPSRFPQPGIGPSYVVLIKAAFQNEWRGSNQIVTFPGTTDPDGTVTMVFDKNFPSNQAALTTDQFTQLEANFSLFWGIAVQMYEATLRADDSTFDRAFDSGNPSTFTAPGWGPAEKVGLDVFQNKGKCIACHSGPELTNASVSNVQNEKIERMIMGDDGIAVYDTGFYNTAVTRCAGQAGPCDDLGVGAKDGPLSLPLSFSRFYQMPANCGFGTNASGTGCLNAPPIEPRPLENIAFQLLQPGERVAVDGAFKTPGLRNVALTAPYFHNSGDLTLEDVVEFYNQGGHFPAINRPNIDIEIEPLGLTADEKAGLVALMRSMTDQRVAFQMAPFDRPQICVPNLPAGLLATVLSLLTPNACPAGTTNLPAVGRNGSVPLATFQQNLP